MVQVRVYLVVLHSHEDANERWFRELKIIESDLEAGVEAGSVLAFKKLVGYKELPRFHDQGSPEIGPGSINWDTFIQDLESLGWIYYLAKARNLQAKGMRSKAPARPPLCHPIAPERKTSAKL